MSFAIDESKLAEELQKSGGGYVVSMETAGPIIENFDLPFYGNLSASGFVVPEYSHAVRITRQNLTTARNRIVKSGVQLKSSEELTKEIEEMRGESR